MDETDKGCTILLHVLGVGTDGIVVADNIVVDCYLNREQHKTLKLEWSIASLVLIFACNIASSHLKNTEKIKEVIKIEPPQSKVLLLGSGKLKSSYSLIPDPERLHPSHTKFTVKLLQQQLDQLYEDEFERLAATVDQDVVAKQVDDLIAECTAETLQMEQAETKGMSYTYFFCP